MVSDYRPALLLYDHENGRYDRGRDYGRARGRGHGRVRGRWHDHENEIYITR